MIEDHDADSRLSGLELFLEFWLGPRKPEYGESLELLDKLKLPDPLKRFHAFAGRWPPPHPPHTVHRFCVQDRLLPLVSNGYESIYESGAYLVFARENQGVWDVATLPRGEDPGVWVSEDCSHRTPNPIWRELEHPLSHFLVTLVLQETMFGSDHLACHEEALDKFKEAGCKIEAVRSRGEFAWPDVRLSHYLIDGRILAQQGEGKDWGDDIWYGYKDAATGEFIERLGLPRTIR